MTDRRRSNDRPRKPPRPLDPGRLDELALAYVGRFATTRAKLAQYLRRKIREKGWDGERAPDIEALVERIAALGYVDDAAFAVAKARSLGQRGYGGRRVDQALRQAGVDERDGAPARALAGEGAVTAAVRFAQRRRLGPFATSLPDPATRARGLAAMVRAGHDFDLARRIIDLSPNPELEFDSVIQAFHAQFMSV